MSTIRRRAGRLRVREDGSATIEFVILFPIFMLLFISCFELGTIMLRQTMLDRSIDMTVRQIRVGAVPVVDHDTIKEMICERSSFLTDCSTELKLEMQVVDPLVWTNLDPDVDCVDHANPAQPPKAFVPGGGNRMVVLRACHLFEPYFTDLGIGTVLGDLMPTESGNSYRLVSITSYVVEPTSGP